MSWKIDLSNSKIVFTVRHLLITRVRGTMDRFSGLIEFDPENPASSSVRADIDPASINTRLGIRDANVRAVLLKVKKQPAITYQSKRIKVIDDSRGLVFGDLTIHGIAKQVVLDVEHEGLNQNKDGMTTATFHAVTRLNRKDWGLNWMPLLEIGGLFVAAQLDVDIQIVAIKENEPMPQPMESILSEAKSTRDEVV